ncbi:hypothetical protein R2601_03823 [Salipiger bermudensis HTCC2601]|uniref:Uncharacterized protein n=1 Tax=Salipiger bermudensis (strain DSM 26914 / JCM 13377 / KCTC 12554 / HTCC2601) TaxID=314265 RepID=Q0FW81_SALBH|nr:hypothetical protein R2601_03823 [Salipiger bermudensis HTCC2601]
MGGDLVDRVGRGAGEGQDGAVDGATLHCGVEIVGRHLDRNRADGFDQEVQRRAGGADLLARPVRHLGIGLGAHDLVGGQQAQLKRLDADLVELGLEHTVPADRLAPRLDCGHGRLRHAGQKRHALQRHRRGLGRDGREGHLREPLLKRRDPLVALDQLAGGEIVEIDGVPGAFGDAGHQPLDPLHRHEMRRRQVGGDDQRFRGGRGRCQGGAKRQRRDQSSLFHKISSLLDLRCILFA